MTETDVTCLIRDKKIMIAKCLSKDLTMCSRRVCLVVISFVFIMFISDTSLIYGASPGRAVRKGNDAYGSGDYKEALDLYNRALEKLPESDIINFNLGTALYKDGQYSQAIEALQKSLLTEDVDLKAKAHYNLGNGFLKRAVQEQGQDLDAAIHSVEDSVVHFQKVLELSPQEEDARINLQVAQKVLEELKEKRRLKQKSQQGREGDSKQNQASSDQNQESGEQNQEDQSQQNNEQQNKQNQSTAGDDDGAQQSAESNQQDSEHLDEDQDSDNELRDDTNENKNKAAGDDSQEKETGAQQGQTREGDQDKDMTQTEAARLLRSFQQTEEPKGLLNFYKGQRRPQPVNKDW